MALAKTFTAHAAPTYIDVRESFGIRGLVAEVGRFQ